jgi:hypothetical protein
MNAASVAFVALVQPSRPDTSTSRPLSPLNAAAHKKDLDWAEGVARLQKSTAPGTSGLTDSRSTAYKLFARVDSDVNGKITAWELARYLALSLSVPLDKTFEISFPYPEFGLQLTAAKSKQPSVAKWDHDSHGASEDGPSLYTGLELLAVNGTPVEPHRDAVRRYAALTRSLPRDGRTPMQLTFATPAHLLSSNDSHLDLRVAAKDYSIALPCGAHSTRAAFAAAVTAAVRAAAPAALGDFTCVSSITDSTDTSTAAVAAVAAAAAAAAAAVQPEAYAMELGGTPFRVMWGTGANADQNCMLHFGLGIASSVVRDSSEEARHVFTPAKAERSGVGGAGLVLAPGGLLKVGGS